MSASFATWAGAPQPELLIASHNRGKLREIDALVSPLGFRVSSAADLGLPEPDETADSYEGNAAIKSESACRLSGKAALADDSGLSVAALGGAPGIYSARWAGADKNFSVAMERVKSELIAAGVAPEGAAACFVCVLALSVPNQETVFFRGEVHGALTFPPRGEHGFGYDPIFVPDGHLMTFAELPAETKHQLSHRAIAFAKFVAFLKQLTH